MRANHKAQTPIKTPNGFTLLEVLVSLTVLAVGMLAVATLLNMAIRVNDKARDVTDGATIAADQVEYLMSLPLTDTDWSTLPSDNPHQENQGNYLVRWDVLDDTPTTGSVLVNLRVTWTDHGVEKIVPVRFVRTKLL